MDVKVSVVCLLAVLASASCISYEGYKVYQVTTSTVEQYNFLNYLEAEENYDFLRRAPNVDEPNDVVVSPQKQAEFENVLKQKGLKYSTTVDNLENVIQKEAQQLSMTPFLALGGVTFRSYMSHDQQNAYLRNLASSYSNIATVELMGRSYEGRELLLIKISSGPSTTTVPKPIIFIDAGIHAREWIAPPVALYIIQQLVEKPENAALYANVDWHIIPVLNPDGYQFTQVEDRLWRKTRRPNENNNCYGTDGNRNFDYQWMVAGASDNPCAQTYAGPKPFSEPETAALRDWINKYKNNIRLYLTIHSFGSLLLYPWGYATIVPDNEADLLKVGRLAAEAIYNANTFKSVYTVNTSALALGVAAGGSDDWVKAVGGVALSYTVELPSANSPYIFMNPRTDILPICQEFWDGTKAFHSYIQQNFWNDLQTPS